MISGLLEKVVSAIIWVWSYPVGKFGLIIFGAVFVYGLIADVREWDNKYKMNSNKHES